MAIRWDTRLVWGLSAVYFSTYSFPLCHIVRLEPAFPIDVCSDGLRRRRRWLVDMVRESTLYETDLFFELGHQ